jgi:VWFA-related protein
MNRHHKNMRQTPAILAFGLLATAVGAIAQLAPGQLPSGPPAQPGQLGTEPRRSSEKPPQSAPPQSRQSTPAPEPTGEGVFRLPVENVLVPTTVLDPDGHGYVNGLSTRDFEVLDNGKPQKVVADFSQQPLSVVLAIQANSDVEPLLPKIKKSGILLHGLVTGENGDVAILAFDHRMQLLQDFTSDPDKLDDAMQKLRAGSSTAALVDAVVEADRMLVRHDRDHNNARRRVLILLSRNADKGSEAHLQETVRDMQFHNVIVYCIDISKVLTAVLKKPDYPRPMAGGIPPEAQPNLRGNGAASATTNIQQADGNVLSAVPPIFRGIHDLFKKTPAEILTQFTGGRMYNFAREKGLEDAITDIGKDLNSQYVLSYSPNNKEEPGFHNIKVSVDRPGLIVRTRPGYWWGGGQIQ